MNDWHGIGNLTKDPVSHVTESGKDVCKFTIAVNRPKNEEGESEADFIPIKAIGKRAALCREYLRKGRKVGIGGTLQTYNYTFEGQRRFGFEILVDDITFLPSGSPNNTRLGDIHQDDGVVHSDVGEPFDVTGEIDGELPF